MCRCVCVYMCVYVRGKSRKKGMLRRKWSEFEKKKRKKSRKKIPFEKTKLRLMKVLFSLSPLKPASLHCLDSKTSRASPQTREVGQPKSQQPLLKEDPNYSQRAYEANRNKRKELQKTYVHLAQHRGPRLADEARSSIVLCFHSMLLLYRDATVHVELQRKKRTCVYIYIYIYIYIYVYFQMRQKQSHIRVEQTTRTEYNSVTVHKSTFLAYIYIYVYFIIFRVHSLPEECVYVRQKEH